MRIQAQSSVSGRIHVALKGYGRSVGIRAYLVVSRRIIVALEGYMLPTCIHVYPCVSELYAFVRDVDTGFVCINMYLHVS